MPQGAQPDAVTPFVFPVTGAAVRVTSQDGEPWSVAKDVFDALGAKTKDLPVILDEDEADVHSMDTLGRMQRITAPARIRHTLHF